MADSIVIRLDTSRYRPPTEQDIASAKEFILRRNESARLLESRIDSQLEEAAEQIVTICYKYNINPKEFEISSRYNENMMDEISDVMDSVEAEVLDLIYELSTAVTDDKDSKKMLAAWIATLGRNNNNFQDTLDGYLYKTMKDWGSAIAALRYANIPLADAIIKVRSNLHTIYTMPEVIAAMKEADDFNATYIRSRGVVHGNVGLSNNGATNVTNMARITLQMSWMRQQGIEFDESGAAGYYQLRGSSYPCSVCDDEVGFHPNIEEIYTKPLPHPHCCCYRVPIFPLEDVDFEDETHDTPENDNRNAEYLEYLNNPNYTDVEYNPQTGGLKATHLKHNFDRKTGESERIAQRIGFNNGHKVILGIERHDIKNVKNTEGSWDGKKMEIATATTGTANNLIHAISHCGSKPDVRIAVIHIPVGVPTGNMETAVRRFDGLKKSNPKQWHKFDEILFVIEEKDKIKAYHQR